MFLITLITVFVALGIGLGLKWYLESPYNQSDWSDKSITWLEFGITSAVIMFLIAPLTAMVGVKLAINDRVTFHEHRSGWEQSATVQEITCYRDGPCYWTYSCDPYTVCVSCNCDKNGCSTCCHTEYHSCPFCTHEYNYDVWSTIGPFRIGEYRLPKYPNNHRWRPYELVPSNIIERAGEGPPQFWLDAKARIDSGTPGPVTKEFSYNNYLLRANYSILGDYAGQVQDFQAKKLLPPFNTEIHSFYWSDKIDFVNVGVIDPQRWQRQLEYINAELGRSHQGDLHMVIVKGTIDPDAYIMALKAFWQNPDTFGRNTASKNTILVALGTEDGRTVSWARAITGMPMGNEMLIARLRNEFKGMALDPDSVIGKVTAHLENGQIKSVDVRGGLGEYVLSTQPFTRIPMRGYEYLKKEIRPTTGGYIVVTLVSIIFCLLTWIPAVAIGDRFKSTYQRYYR